MKKILVLTPRFPYPVIGGDRLRIYRLCQALSKQFELTLLSLCETEKEMEMSISDDVFSEVHRVLLTKARSMLNVLKSLPTSTPLQVAYYSSKEYSEKIDQLLPKHDATLSHLVRVGNYLIGKPGLHFLEMTDAISLNYKRVRDVAPYAGLKSIIYSIEQSRLEKYERDIVQHFSISSLVSEVDRDFLFGQTEPSVVVCGNGVDVKSIPFQRRTIEKGKTVRLAFIGNMLSLQNLDAVFWFAENILPKLNAEASYILKVIGRISQSDKEKLSSYENIVVTGVVDSVPEAAADCHVGVCPVRLGAGVQNKILEYMALGLPCVTSTIGFEGIGAESGKQILIADDLAEYNRVFDKLIGDIDSYQMIAENARKYVEHEFSWERKLSPLVEKIAECFE